MKDRRPPTGATGPDAFARWLHDQLTARGYDLSGQRSGGRTRAAADSGLSPSSIGRLLRGDPVTDIDVYRRLAQWLEHPFGDVLVRAGLLTHDDLIAPPADLPTDPKAIAEQAADRLGLKGRRRELFLMNADAIRRSPS